MGINFFTIVLALILVRDAVNLKKKIKLKVWQCPSLPNELYCWYWLTLMIFLVRAGQGRGDPSGRNNSTGRRSELHSEIRYKSHLGWEEEQTQSLHEEWQWNVSGSVLQFMEKIRVNHKQFVRNNSDLWLLFHQTVIFLIRPCYIQSITSKK